MSAYTSGNKAPTLERQHAVKAGNVDHKKVSHKGGATDVTNPRGDTVYAKGHQGAPKTDGSPINGRGQKVLLSKPKEDYAVRKQQAYMDGANKSVNR